MSSSSPSRPVPRKELILERAERHFAEHGFQGASLSAIARDCGVGNPSLLHHFPSKEVLYRAVLERQADELAAHMGQWAANGARDSGGLRARLLTFVTLQLEWMDARPTGAKLLIRELMDNAERIQQAQTRPLEGFLRGSLALMEEAQSAGVVRREISAAVILTIILGALNYAKIARPTFSKAFPEPALKSETAWMDMVARDVLSMVMVSVDHARAD